MDQTRRSLLAGLGSLALTQSIKAQQDLSISAKFASVDFSLTPALLSTMFSELEQRVPRTSGVGLFKLPTDWVGGSPGKPDDPVPAGTVTALVGDPDWIAQLKKRFQSSTVTIAEVQSLKQKLLARVPKPLASAVSEMQALPVIGELRYGGSTMASFIAVPSGVEASVISLPYTGGRLADSFTLTEYVKVGAASARLAAMVISRAPALSALESRALSLLPKENRQLVIGPAAECYAITFVQLAMVVIAACSLCKDQLGTPLTLPPNALQSMGPAATVAEMLSRRRSLLGHPF